ncbi:hypothetical protein C6501_15755 [Candidatus Poribacteria bacterium]|nr:MAG: hypothetical protein C6501_15755 [Candidatus Poribacteria bacterium]
MHLQKVGFLCFLLLLLSTAAHAKIVFSSTREGVPGIYVMDDDGSNQTLLTESEKLRPRSCTWSRDGKHILFKKSIRDAGRDEEGVWRVISGSVLFLMNPDGTNIRQLTENDGSSIGRTSFSPDGTSIVFNRIVRIDNKEKPSITVLNIETGKMKAIADINANFCDWSPDGKHIIFSKPLAVGGGGNTIWIMGADGHNPRPLVPEPPAGGVVIHRWKQRWSPDGKKIVFTQREYTWEPIPNVGIALIDKAHRYMICDRNGENIKRLQIPKDWYPVSIDWMDDGKSVVFCAEPGTPLNEPIPRGFVFPPANIYKYHIETHVITQLTDDLGNDGTVDWISDDVLPVSPRGKKKVTWGALKK